MFLHNRLQEACIDSQFQASLQADNKITISKVYIMLLGSNIGYHMLACISTMVVIV